jgi:hypothetical protein
MSRDIDSGLADAVAEKVVRPFFAFRLETPDPVYAFTGVGQMTFPDADGVDRTWIGAGDFGSLDTLTEANDGSATGIKATLFKIPGEFRDDIADQAVPGVKMDVGIGAFDETFQNLEGFAWLNRYKLDDYKITDGGNSLTVQVSGENRSIDQKRPAIKRFTDERQQRVYPGDLFFQFVSKMGEVSILWAQASQNSVATGGGIGAGGDSGGGSRFNYNSDRGGSFA